MRQGLRLEPLLQARVDEETLAPGAVVSEVARQHGLTPQQVFTSRRQLRQVAEDIEPQAPRFAREMAHQQ
jgi:transposase